MKNENGRVPPGQDTGDGLSHQSIHVSLQTDTLNIHSSNISALQRLAEQNPALAEKLVDAAQNSVGHDTTRYVAGAVIAGIVCCTMLICFAFITAYSGVGPGLVFFLVCAAVATIFSIVFTGRSESLAWTVDFFRGHSRRDQETQEDN